MFGLAKLTAAVNALADRLQALAATAEEVNAGVRARLALDPEDAPAPAQLAGPPEADAPAGRRGRKAAG